MEKRDSESKKQKLQVREITYKHDPDAAAKCFAMWVDIARRALTHSLQSNESFEKKD